MFNFLWNCQAVFHRTVPFYSPTSNGQVLFCYNALFSHCCRSVPLYMFWILDPYHIYDLQICLLFRGLFYLSFESGLWCTKFLISIKSNLSILSFIAHRLGVIAKFDVIKIFSDVFFFWKFYSFRSSRTHSSDIWRTRSLLSTLSPASCIRNSFCHPRCCLPQRWRIKDGSHKGEVEIHWNLPASPSSSPLRSPSFLLESRVQNSYFGQFLSVQ